MTIFIVSEAVFVLVALPSLIWAGELPSFFAAWLPYTALLAFVLGTFASVDLSQNERGRVQLSKTWRVCFWTWSTTPVRHRDYESVSVGLAYETDIMDWLMCLALLPLGILPGLLWFYYIVQPDTCLVALCKDHGYPECILFRTKNDKLARQLAATVHETTGLPLEK